MTSSERAESLKRSLALLWGKADEPTRGPKPALTRERIVETAIAIADQEGVGALSMRRIAAALNVGAMSLYRYVPGKDELIDLMVDHSYGEGPALDETGGWRERLEAVCRGEWAHYHRHPWLLHVQQGRPLMGPNALLSTEAALRILDGTGLDGREMIDAIVTTSSWVAGLARTSVEASRAATETGVSDDEWWAAQEPYLSDAMGERYPMLGRVAESGGFDGPTDRSFEFGLRRVLDGLEVLIAARRAGEHPDAG
ncbi:TetR/AcrR family transcriptional regulator [Pseudonocardia lacus]|uniref:TetR/AcrR family transcriptional regulator n=1 Tax=Pseudonocardia lacus TaxID=2835865 RepID=UPI001BDBC3BF|nr:TetR/AcrR family transcriptional regulator [Pseudonocardia lacus]